MSGFKMLLCPVAGLSISACAFGCAGKGDRSGGWPQESASPTIVVHADEGATSPPTPEEPARPAGEGCTRQQLEEARVLLENFVHYVAIAMPDLAAAAYQSLLDIGISNVELALILDREIKRSSPGPGRRAPPRFEFRFEAALQSASRYSQLDAIADELTLRVELGRSELQQRDP